MCLNKSAGIKAESSYYPNKTTANKNKKNHIKKLFLGLWRHALIIGKPWDELRKDSFSRNFERMIRYSENKGI